MVIGVVGSTDKLNYEDLGSTCCGAKVIDPGNTGEGLCSDCKEHCGIAYTQEIDIAVLSQMDADNRVHIHRVTYESDGDTDYDDFVESRVAEHYDSDVQYIADDQNPIVVLDHRVKQDAKT